MSRLDSFIKIVRDLDVGAEYENPDGSVTFIPGTFRVKVSGGLTIRVSQVMPDVDKDVSEILVEEHTVSAIKKNIKRQYWELCIEDLLENTFTHPMTLYGKKVFLSKAIPEDVILINPGTLEYLLRGMKL